ncbi:immunity protein Imm33 domain-containing protein [Neorhizobium vignae]|uniref:immunity protein Imm33 domain-containing protein n=1 Tax=Neorhizobium vignae TaxID=690585 RepID=UPI0009FEB2B9
MERSLSRNQVEVCLRYGVTFTPSALLSKLGISDSALQGRQPLNGLRHPPEAGTSGWFIWGGEEFSTDPGFFKPMHVSHLGERCLAVVPYLGLPPGWRFLSAPNYEDAWFDVDLLNTP